MRELAKTRVCRRSVLLSHCSLFAVTDHDRCFSRWGAPCRPPTYEIYDVDGEHRIRVEVDGAAQGVKVAVQPEQRGRTLSVHWVPRGTRRALAAHYIHVPNAK